jgi:hypothetical protein
MPCLFKELVSISNFCDLLLYPIMQVIILEYVIPRVLEYPCVKFNRISTSKTRLINILPSGSVLTRHIWHMFGHVQTRQDISGLLGLFTSLSVNSSWVPHRAFTSCFLALMPCTHSCSMFLKEMAHGDERRSKHRQDVGASSSGPSVKP